MLPTFRFFPEILACSISISGEADSVFEKEDGRSGRVEDDVEDEDLFEERELGAVEETLEAGSCGSGALDTLELDPLADLNSMGGPALEMA